jgi:hypothetical protein
MDIGVNDLASENPSFAIANLKRIDTLEREKTELLAQLETFERQLRDAKVYTEERDERIHQIELELASYQASE